MLLKSAKQEKFVQNLIKGMSQRQAYKNSYDAENMKDETIDRRACELLKDGKVKARYEELLSEIANEAIMSARDRQIWLSDVITGKRKILLGDAEAEACMSDKLKALDILNKMDGQYIERVQNINPPTIKIERPKND